MANTPLEHINYNGTTYDIQPLRLKYIVGTGTAAVTTSPYTHTKWEASAPEITELYDGLTIIYKVPVAGNGSYGTALQINDLGYHPVVTQTNTMISTRYGVGAIILLVYTTSLSGTLYQNSGSSSRHRIKVRACSASRKSTGFLSLWGFSLALRSWQGST